SFTRLLIGPTTIRRAFHWRRLRGTLSCNCMARPSRERGLIEGLERERITQAAERADTALARDGADLRRLRRHGFNVAALDKQVLARHDRRYSLQLPFGQVENQG